VIKRRKEIYSENKSSFMLPASIQKNDKLASILIIIFSVIVFVAVVFLSRIKLDVELPFNVHLFAQINAVINSVVSFLLLVGLLAVKRGNYQLHKKVMMSAMVLSLLFLVSYICHHLFSESTSFGGEGAVKSIYYFILITHIILAAVILPFILYTSYRALVAEWPAHRKLAKITWPIWFYVSVTGVVVYLMISPYYV
jgi:putative membrane protein